MGVKFGTEESTKGARLCGSRNTKCLPNSEYKHPIGVSLARFYDLFGVCGQLYHQILFAQNTSHQGNTSCAVYAYAVVACLSVSPSQVGVLLKWINVGSR